MPLGDPWILAIDFGTSNCVVAVRTGDGPPEVVEIDGDRRVPAVVFVADSGELVVGRVADDLATSDPARALRAPKGHLGEPHPVVIAGRPWDTTALAAAVLGYLAGEAITQMGSPPAELRLTYPATWSGPRRDQLRRAAVAAGLPEPVLIPEPVAAAIAYADAARVPVGAHIAVYDLGGGTFDTTVLRVEGENDFVIAGRPTGDGQIGGELFDELLLDDVRARLVPATQEALVLAATPAWLQADARLRIEVRRAKESLSSHPYADVVVATPAGLERIRITRDRLDALVRPYLEESVLILAQSVEAAGLTRSDLAAIHLAGGTSRVPLVATVLRDAFPGVVINRRGDPKTCVAIGAATLARASAPAPAPLPRPAAAPPDFPVLTPSPPPRGARSPATLGGPSGPPGPPSRPPVPSSRPPVPSSRPPSGPPSGPAWVDPDAPPGSGAAPGPQRRPQRAWVAPAAIGLVSAVIVAGLVVGLLVSRSHHSAVPATSTTSATSRPPASTTPTTVPSPLATAPGSATTATTAAGAPTTTAPAAGPDLAALESAALTQIDFATPQDFTPVSGGTLCGDYLRPSEYAISQFRLSDGGQLDNVVGTYPSSAQASEALSEIPGSRSDCIQAAAFTPRTVAGPGGLADQSYFAEGHTTLTGGQAVVYFLGLVREGRNISSVEFLDPDTTMPLSAYEGVVTLAARKLSAVPQ